MNKEIKRWIDSTAKKYKSVIHYKKDIGIHVIIVPKLIEQDKDFRDFTVDFLFDFEMKTREDLIIVSDQDKMYSYTQYDYVTYPSTERSDFSILNYITGIIKSGFYHTEITPTEKLTLDKVVFKEEDLKLTTVSTEKYLELDKRICSPV